MCRSLGKIEWGLQSVCPMKVGEEEAEAYLWVACRLQWFVMQGMRYFERGLAAWG